MTHPTKKATHKAARLLKNQYNALKVLDKIVSY